MDKKPFEIKEVKKLTFADKANVAGQDVINKIIGYTMSFKEMLDEPKRSWVIILGVFAIFWETIRNFYIFVKTKTRPFFVKAKEKSLTFYENLKPKVEELFQKMKSKFSNKVEDSSPQSEDTSKPQS